MGLEACGEALNIVAYCGYHLETLRFYWFYIYILPSKSGSSPKTVRLPSKIPECYPKH